jgi:hypothetical protein
MADAARLDPEELKDALIQQAQAERRRVLRATLRQGTGRRPPKCSFQVVVRPFEPTPQPPPPQAAPGAIIPESQMAQFHSNQDNTAGTGADGLSPMEGVPELRLAVNSSWTPSVAAAGMYHQQQQRSSSPIKGVVSHATVGNNNRALQPQNAPQQDFSFGGGYDDDDDYGGADDFGGGYDDYGGGDDGGFQDYGRPSPNQEGGARQPYLFGNNNTRMQMYQQDPSRPRPRRHVLNPGIRLRNELPRKSFAYDASMGRQEVAPGIRRSTRRAKSPLRWWLNEVKVYGREHKTMPTVEENVKMASGAIWRTAVDPLSKRGRIDHDFGGAKRARTKSRHVAAAHDDDYHEQVEGAASPSSSPAAIGRKRSKGGRSRSRNNNSRSRQSKQQQQSESDDGGGFDSENDSMMVDGEDVDNNNAVGGLSTVHEEEGEDGIASMSAAAPAPAAIPSSIKCSRGRPQPASSSDMGLFDMFEDTDIGDATTETNGAAAAGAKDDDDVDDGAVSQPAPVQEEAMQVGNGVVVDPTLQDAPMEEEEEGQLEVDLAVVDQDDDDGLQELIEAELAALSPTNALLCTAANNALFSPAVEDDGGLEEGEVDASPVEMVAAHAPAHGDEEFADDEALLEEEEVLEEEDEEEGEEVIVSSGAGNGVEEVEVDVEEEQLPEEEGPMNDDEEEEEKEEGDVPSPIMGGDEKDEEVRRVNQQVVVEGEDGDEAIDSDAETVGVSPIGATGSMAPNGGGVTMRRSARR